MKSVQLVIVAAVLTAAAAGLGPSPIAAGELGDRPPDGVPIAACIDDKFDFAGMYLPHGTGIENYTVSTSALTSAEITAMGGQSAILAAIQRGFNVWNQAKNDCGFTDNSDLNFTRVGTFSGTGEHDNGVNEVYFADPGYLQLQDNTLGIAEPCTVNGCGIWAGDLANPLPILEWRIYLNADMPWSTANNPPSGKVTLEDLVAHEVGHIVGLKDIKPRSCGQVSYGLSLDPKARHAFLTMYGCSWYAETHKRTLAKGDYLGLGVTMGYRNA